MSLTWLLYGAAAAIAAHALGLTSRLFGPRSAARPHAPAGDVDLDALIDALVASAARIRREEIARVEREAIKRKVLETLGGETSSPPKADAADRS